MAGVGPPALGALGMPFILSTVKRNILSILQPELASNIIVSIDIGFNNL